MTVPSAFDDLICFISELGKKGLCVLLVCVPVLNVKKKKNEILINKRAKRIQNTNRNLKEKRPASNTFSIGWSGDLWAVWVTEE